MKKKNPAAVALGKMGRAKNTPAQQASSRENGKKGGCPPRRVWVIVNNSNMAAFIREDKILSDIRDDLKSATKYRAEESAQKMIKKLGGSWYYSEAQKGFAYCGNYAAEEFIFIPATKRAEMIEKINQQGDQDGCDYSAVVKNLEETGYVESQFVD